MSILGDEQLLLTTPNPALIGPDPSEITVPSGTFTNLNATTGTFTNLVVAAFGISNISLDTITPLTSSVTIDTMRFLDDPHYIVPTRTVSSMLADNAAAGSTTISIVPKGTGAFALAIPDGTAIGGDTRGDNAVDLQIVRAASTQVASGLRSAIVGGVNNTNGGTNSIILAGDSNSITGGSNSAIVGSSNVNVGNNCFLVGNNNISNNGFNIQLGFSTTSNGFGNHIFRSDSAPGVYTANSSNSLHLAYDGIVSRVQTASFENDMVEHRYYVSDAIGPQASLIIANIALADNRAYYIRYETCVAGGNTPGITTSHGYVRSYRLGAGLATGSGVFGNINGNSNGFAIAITGSYAGNSLILSASFTVAALSYSRWRTHIRMVYSDFL